MWKLFCAKNNLTLKRRVQEISALGSAVKQEIMSKFLQVKHYNNSFDLIVLQTLEKLCAT